MKEKSVSTKRGKLVLSYGTVQKVATRLNCSYAWAKHRVMSGEQVAVKMVIEIEDELRALRKATAKLRKGKL